MGYEFGDITVGTPRANYVGAPVDEIRRVSEALDKKYKNNLDGANILETALSNIQVQPGDNEYKANAVNQLKGTLQQIKDSGKYELAAPIIAKASRDFATNTDLIDAQKANMQVLTARADLNKQLQEGKIDREDYELAVKAPENQYTTLPPKDEWGFRSVDYKIAPPPHKFDFADEADKFIKGYLANKSASVTPSYDPNTGVFTGWTTKENTFISYDEVSKALRKRFAGDNAAMDVINYRKNYGVDMKGRIDNIISAYGNKAAYSQQEETFKDDPLRLGRAAGAGSGSDIESTSTRIPVGIPAVTPEQDARGTDYASHLNAVQTDNTTSVANERDKYFAKDGTEFYPIVGYANERALVDGKPDLDEGEKIVKVNGADAIINTKDRKTDYVKSKYDPLLEEAADKNVQSGQADREVNKEIVRLAALKGVDIKLTKDGHLSNDFISPNTKKSLKETEEAINKVNQEIQEATNNGNTKKKAELESKLISFEQIKGEIKDQINREVPNYDEIYNEAVKNVYSKKPQFNHGLAITPFPESEGGRKTDFELKNVLNTNPNGFGSWFDAKGTDRTNELTKDNGELRTSDLVPTAFYFSRKGVGKHKGWIIQVQPQKGKDATLTKGDPVYIDGNAWVVRNINRDMALKANTISALAEQFENPGTNKVALGQDVTIEREQDGDYSISYKGKLAGSGYYNGQGEWVNTGQRSYKTLEDAVSTGLGSISNAIQGNGLGKP